MLDKDVRMTQDVQYIKQKRTKVCRALNSLMLNMVGSRSTRRKLVVKVVLSTILYAASVRGKELRHDIYKKQLQQIQDLFSA